MERLTVKERANWREKLEHIGFTFHSMAGAYWNEGACYAFSSAEIDHLEAVTDDLHEKCLDAVQYVIDGNLFNRMGIDEKCAALIKSSWKREDKSLYGRFDFSYDGRSEPKLLEYNADTPTSLVESSIAQWAWLEDVFPDYDQFNSIHEKLLDAFNALKLQMPFSTALHFSCVKDCEEDRVTVEYMRDVASQTGLQTKFIHIEDIGFSEETRLFYDLAEEEIRFLFKLYPWEWIISDDFGRGVFHESMRLIEPPWKLILSNKAILPILWEMVPNHPNLLPSFFDDSHLKGRFVKKPFFSREGANITYFQEPGSPVSTPGTYGAEGFIYQELKPLPEFGGNFALVGSWVVNNLSAGIGIREDSTPIIQNTSRFVPHFFKP